MLKGDTQRFEVVLTRELEVLAIPKWGSQNVVILQKEGGAKCFYPVLRGGGGVQ